MDKFEKKLGQLLFRTDCPDIEQLTDYIMEDLPAEQMAKIEQHLLLCQHCSNEVQMTRASFVQTTNEHENRREKSFLDQLSAIPESLGILFANVVGKKNDDLQFALRNTVSRGMVFEVDDIEIDLSWAEQRDGYFVISGGLNADTLPSSANIRLDSLLNATKTQEVVAELDTGELTFRFSPVSTGLYVVTAITPENRIIIPPIKIE